MLVLLENREYIDFPHVSNSNSQKILYCCFKVKTRWSLSTNRNWLFLDCDRCVCDKSKFPYWIFVYNLIHDVCYSYDLFIRVFYTNWFCIYIHFLKKIQHIQSVWFSRCTPEAVWRQVICHENTGSQSYNLWFFLSVPWPLVQGFWIFLYCFIMILSMNEER